MAKTVSDLQTDLAYRLGESAAPSNTAELAKRRNWMRSALENLVGGDKPLWFSLNLFLDTSADDEPYYTYPARCRRIERIKVDNREYESAPFDEIYDRYETPLSPVPILPRQQLKRVYYIRNNKIYILPKPDAPTSYTVSSATSSGTTVTITTSEEHGYYEGYYVTIAGADQSEYNGDFEITEVPSTTTFTYEADTAPSVTPATGTITATRQNIEIWGYKDERTTLDSWGESSSIIVPDNFSDLLVSYAEGRYWSTAHKRGKASDAFAEYESWLDKIKKEDFRRRFGET